MPAKIRVEAQQMQSGNLGLSYAENDEMTPENLPDEFGNNEGSGMRLQSCPEPRGVNN